MCRFKAGAFVKQCVTSTELTPPERDRDQWWVFLLHGLDGRVFFCQAWWDYVSWWMTGAVTYHRHFIITVHLSSIFWLILYPSLSVITHLTDPPTSAAGRIVQPGVCHDLFIRFKNIQGFVLRTYMHIVLSVFCCFSSKNIKTYF